MTENKYLYAIENKHLLNEEQINYITAEMEQDMIRGKIDINKKRQEFNEMSLSNKLYKISKNLGLCLYYETIARMFNVDEYNRYLLAKELAVQRNT